MSGGITGRTGYGGKSLPETWGKIAGAGGLIRAGSGGPGGGGPPATVQEARRPGPGEARREMATAGAARPGRAGTVQACGMIDGPRARGAAARPK